MKVYDMAVESSPIHWWSTGDQSNRPHRERQTKDQIDEIFYP